MPKLRPIDEAALDQVYHRSVTEKIIGTDERDRTTKTNIPTKDVAFRLSVLRNHAMRCTELVRRKHLAETGILLSNDQVWDLYRGVRSYVEIHDQILRHLSSVDGFGIRAAIRMETLRSEERERAQVRRGGENGAAADGTDKHD